MFIICHVLTTDVSNEEATRMVLWIQHQNDSIVTTKRLWFDPAADWHDYEMVLNEDNPDANVVKQFKGFYHTAH